MNKIFILIFIGIICHGLYGQSEFSANMRDYDINVVLMKNTFRISGANGECGSVFILGKSKTNKLKDFDRILVTAGHVLDSIKGEMAWIDFRIQVADTFQILSYPIKIRNKKLNFYKRHPKADVAAMYITLPKMYQDTNVILMQSYLCTDADIENWRILPGTKLKCLGYPHCIGIGNGLFPILRNGEIASYPLIPSSKYPVFYFDFEIYPGNSGGPVYFQERGRLNSFGGGNNQDNVQLIVGLVTHQIYSSLIDSKSLKIIGNTDLKLGLVVQSSFILETIRMLP